MVFLVDFSFSSLSVFFCLCKPFFQLFLLIPFWATCGGVLLTETIMTGRSLIQTEKDIPLAPALLYVTLRFGEWFVVVMNVLPINSLVLFH